MAVNSTQAKQQQANNNNRQLGTAIGEPGILVPLNVVHYNNTNNKGFVAQRALKPGGFLGFFRFTLLLLRQRYVLVYVTLPWAVAGVPFSFTLRYRAGVKRIAARVQGPSVAVTSQCRIYGMGGAARKIPFRERVPFRESLLYRRL